MHKNDFLNAISKGNCDILHFSGHANFDLNHPDKSSLIFMDKSCSASEINDSLKQNSPILVFCNACSSAQSMVGQQGLVQAFMLNGTSNFIGTLWPVDDQLAGMIGEEFYRYLIYGKTVGEALRLAKINTYKKFGWSSISWAAYVLYGDPKNKIIMS